MAIRLLHLADIHLGAKFAHLGAKAAERSADLNHAFERAIDYAVARENNIDAVLIAGDLFHSHAPEPALVSFAQAQFERLCQRGIPSIIIPGTHDGYGYRGSVYRSVEFPGARLILAERLSEPIIVELGGQPVSFYGMAYDPARPAEPFSGFRRPNGGLNIALLHCSLTGSPEWNIRKKDLPVSREQIARSGLNYVALGHYHNYYEFREAGVTAVYPGTLEGLRFGENGPRWLVVAEVAEDGTRIERTEFNRRTLEETDLDLTREGISDNDGVVSWIERRANPSLILKVTLTGAADFVPDTAGIEEALQDKLFHLEVADATRLYDSSLIKIMASENTIRGILLRNLEQKIAVSEGRQRRVYELALKLAADELKNSRLP